MTHAQPPIVTATPRMLIAHARAATELGKGIVEAHTSVFDVEFTDTEYTWAGPVVRQVIIDRGAFTASLRRKPTAPIIWQHHWDAGPVGQTVEETQDNVGLRIIGELYLDDDLPRRIWRTMLSREDGSRGSVTEWSIGFYVIREREETRGGKYDRYPQPSLWHYQEIDRVEHSIVLRGANPATGTIRINDAATTSDTASSDVERLQRLLRRPSVRAALDPARRL